MDLLLPLTAIRTQRVRSQVCSQSENSRGQRKSIRLILRLTKRRWRAEALLLFCTRKRGNDRGDGSFKKRDRWPIRFLFLDSARFFFLFEPSVLEIVFKESEGTASVFGAVSVERRRWCESSYPVCPWKARVLFKNEKRGGGSRREGSYVIELMSIFFFPFCDFSLPRARLAGWGRAGDRGFLFCPLRTHASINRKKAPCVYMYSEGGEEGRFL